MKRTVALVLSLGLITAAAASVNAASLLTDQVLLTKQSQETGMQTLRDMMTWHFRGTIIPQKGGIQPMQKP